MGRAPCLSLCLLKRREAFCGLRPRSGKRYGHVPTQLLRGVRRANRARALEALDEQAFLFVVRRPFSRGAARRAARRLGRSAAQRLRRRSPDASRPAAAPHQPRDDARVFCVQQSFKARDYSSAGQSGQRRCEARRFDAALRRGRHARRTTHRPRRNRLHLRRAHKKGHALLASRARHRPLLAAQGTTRHAPAREAHRRRLKQAMLFQSRAL